MTKSAADLRLDLDQYYEALINFIVFSKHQLIRAAADYGLTNVQAMVLLMIHSDRPRPMNSFCGALGCDPSNITGIIDGLQKKELITRTESPQDRRVKMVYLQPKGEAIREALLRRMSDENQSTIMSTLTTQELNQFTTLLRKITANCPAMPAKAKHEA